MPSAVEGDPDAGTAPTLDDVADPQATRIEAATGLARPGEVDPRPWLARLRAEFPRWAFLYDPWARLWVAVRGRHRIQAAPTAFALHDRLSTDSSDPTRNGEPP